MVLIYTMIVMVALLGFASFAVDLGRVQLTKMELSRLADAAARAAANEMPNGQSAAILAAKNIAALNKVEETEFSLTDADIAFGAWDPQTGDFIALPNNQYAQANAVMVTAVRWSSRQNALKLIFGTVIGMTEINLSSVAVAMTGGVNDSASTSITGKANVWFAGLPNTASAAYGGDITYASSCPAGEFTGFNVTPGAKLSFAASGKLSNTTSGGNNPEGNAGSMQQNLTNNLGGKSNIKAPLNALLAVFISDDDPSATAAPAMLDFTSAGSRNYTELSPLLKQTFYIGDGQANGVAQTIVVPAGATRLYFGSMDPYGWHNNSGTCTIDVTSIGGEITLVK